MFITPNKFAIKTGENYNLILEMCKKGTLRCEKTDGGHFKIHETELDRYLNEHHDFISKKEYEDVIRENERLKNFIKQLKKLIESGI